jgi:hypothetical protein
MNNLLKNLSQFLVSKTIRLFLITIVLFFLLSSCSSDDATNNNQTKLLSKMVDIAANGSSATTVFTYNANKIMNVDGVNNHLIFTYTNNLIIKIETFDDASQLQSILNYTYEDDNLIKIASSDNYEMHFIHNANGTVSYEKLTTDSANNEVLVYKGILYFLNGNLTKDERTLVTTATEVSKTIVSYQYDSKVNPLHNVVGYSKLLNSFNAISTNNITRTQEETRKEYINSGQVISSMVLYVSANQYDDAGYPTVITSEKSFFGEQSNHVKSQLTYN